ncbi:MAG: hypothetical protein QOI75_447, partial [Pseudonocardiales bacterium]|nr:hypothetical protein [Pseudonocardiales bacterium]
MDPVVEPDGEPEDGFSPASPAGVDTAPDPA